MRTTHRVLLAMVAAIFLFSIHGCGKSDDKPATTADKIGDAVQSAGKEMGQAIEKAGQEIKEAGEKLKDTSKEGAEKEENQ